MADTRPQPDGDERHLLTVRIELPIRERLLAEQAERSMSANDLVNEALAKRYKLPFVPRGGRQRRHREEEVAA